MAQIPNTEIQRFISGCSLWQAGPTSLALQRKYLLIMLSLMEAGCPQIKAQLRASFPPQLAPLVFESTIQDAGIRSPEEAASRLRELGRVGRMEPIADLIKVLEGLGLPHPPQFEAYYRLLRGCVRKVPIVINGQPH